LWVASTDYSGDLNIDDKILARVVDTYRRIRNTLKFLLANVSDFDPLKDTVAFDDLLEIDKVALSRAAQVQAEIRAHFDAYEFHPVVSKLQLYCSEDLGAFYLDVLKDRLYTTAPKSLARRSAQTALHQITHAMLRWMAPFLSFTAEEAWATFGKSESIFLETFTDLGASNALLMTKWNRIIEIRNAANKEIEVQRTQGLIGSSLQAQINIQANSEDIQLLNSLGKDIKFVFISSKVELLEGSDLRFSVGSAAATGIQKCERCWHYPAYPDQVGQDAAHTSLCSRCISNLVGDGEKRSFA